MTERLELVGSSTEDAQIEHDRGPQIRENVASPDIATLRQSDLRQGSERVGPGLLGECWNWTCLNCCDYDRRAGAESDAGSEELVDESGRVGRR